MTEKMGYLAADALQHDLDETRVIYEHLLADLTPAQWERPSGSSERSWRLWEVVAHLTTVGQGMLKRMDAALDGNPNLHIPTLQGPQDLRAWNEQQIESYRAVDRAELQADFLATFDAMQPYTTADLSTPVRLPVYNRTSTVGHFVAWHLSHSGIIHGAQIPACLGAPPVWEAMSDDLMQRNFYRTISQLSHAYRPDRGGDLRAAFCFKAAGHTGCVQIGPDGGSYAFSQVDMPGVRVTFDRVDDFFGLLTGGLDPFPALLRRQMRVSGRFWLLARLSKLFDPT